MAPSSTMSWFMRLAFRILNKLLLAGWVIHFFTSPKLNRPSASRTILRDNPWTMIFLTSTRLSNNGSNWTTTQTLRAVSSGSSAFRDLTATSFRRMLRPRTISISASPIFTSRRVNSSSFSTANALNSPKLRNW